MLSNDKKNIYALLAGLFLGFVNGFLGGGGGTIAVIALLALYGVEQKQAHATALLVMLPVSVVSAVSYIVAGGVDFAITALVTVGVIGGGLLGSKLLSNCSNNAVKFLFAAITLIAGVKMLFN